MYTSFTPPVLESSGGNASDGPLGQPEYMVIKNVQQVSIPYPSRHPLRYHQDELGV